MKGARHCRVITPSIAKEFRWQFQKARTLTLQDSEAFEGIVHAVERLGSFLQCGCGSSLGDYAETVVAFAESAPSANGYRIYHTPFALLYDLVKDARNDALHIGAFARHLSAHAVQLALMIEDALRMREAHSPAACDYMTRGPVCAHNWEPIGFIRQQMLANSFSYLPIRMSDGWRLVSDFQVAKYLQSSSKAEKKAKLMKTFQESGLVPEKAFFAFAEEPLSSIIQGVTDKPALVFSDKEHQHLVGILTAFDLL